MPIPPIKVQRLGQSIWTDTISRQLITSGELQRLVSEQGVVGLTSNPSIFQKAIGGTADYDDLVKEHVNEDAAAIYEHLVVRDIQDAADILRPVYERTGGVDGFVSLEVSPLLAHDTEGTIADAKKLWAAVDRPNLMIKIPGTSQGIPAVEAVIAAGINVNITLLFSVENYEQVAEAYIRGLEQRLSAGLEVDNIASVASFFVSRIDVMVDSMLENNIRAAQGRDLERVAENNALLGKAAIANARIAYKSYQRLFEGPRFEALRHAGAMVQRLLWASTSTKNPAYPDTFYVDNLIGKNTVNTLPPNTLQAFSDHGTAEETLHDASSAYDIMGRLADVGVDMGQVTHRLQVDGVEQFIDSYETLISQVEAKRVVLKTDIMNWQKLALGIYRDPVERALLMMEKEHVNARMWNRDATVWKDFAPTMAAINQRLGWLGVQKTIDRERLKALQADIQTSDFAHVVLLGMGGSSLAPEVFFKTFGQQAGFPDLHVLDNTNPAQITAVQDAVDLSKTLFIVASKSGSTLETQAFYQYFWEQTGQNGQQFIAITDPGSQLQTIAEENGFRDLFLNPADIGGRYSALSYFGMVPAALIGLDLERLWQYADNMFEAIGEQIPAHSHPGMWLGVIIGELATEKRDKLMLFGSASLNSFGAWVEQLIAESTGKQGRGVLPVAGATVGYPHDYGSDRLFIYFKLNDDPDVDELDQHVRTLREAGHPRVTLILPDKYAIAGEFLRWEYATAVAGRMLNINPFDEPNVAEAKQQTNTLLAHYTQHGAFPDESAVMQADQVSVYATEQTLKQVRELMAEHNFDPHSVTDLLAAQILGTHAGDYFALLAYAAMTDDTTTTLQGIQRQIRHYTRRAVTYGYGPRYLHSTGQLHKGGADCGVFFILTHDAAADLPIPGMAYPFGVLHAAQALGDMQTLAAHKRRAIRLHAAGPAIQPALDVLAAALAGVHERRK